MPILIRCGADPIWIIRPCWAAKEMHAHPITSYASWWTHSILHQMVFILAVWSTFVATIFLWYYTIPSFCPSLSLTVHSPCPIRPLTSDCTHVFCRCDNSHSARVRWGGTLSESLGERKGVKLSNLSVFTMVPSAWVSEEPVENADGKVVSLNSVIV